MGAQGFDGVWSDVLQVVSSEVMDNPQLSEGDRIMLPPSALDRLMHLVPPSRMH